MKIRITVLIMSFIIMAGCQDRWSVLISDCTNPSYPVFCITRAINYCTPVGRGFSYLDFREIDSHGKSKRLMWAIRPTKNIDITSLIYGEAPSGYVEEMEAVPLEVGVLYSIHGKVIFRIVEEDGGVAPEVFVDYGEFLKSRAK